jgi:putative membrane protein
MRYDTSGGKIMMRTKVSDTVKILLWVYGVGLTGMLLPFTRDLFIFITPLNLLFAAAFLFWRTRPEARVIVAGLFIIVTSFLIEAAGVNTGRIFGSYSYGKALGPSVWNTPLIIGLNWFVLIYCTNAIARQLWSRLSAGKEVYPRLAEGAFIIISGSLLMVLYDLLIEPAAMSLDMWSWDGGNIPFRNFIAWFAISLVYHLLYRVWGEGGINRRALPLFIVQLLFFAVIDLFYWIFS